MKQLTKQQLDDLAYDKLLKVVNENIDGMTERLSACFNDKENIATLIVHVLAVYKAEIMKECNQILAETLYDIFYEGKETRNE